MTPTKLPTREDGGMDWKRLWLNGTGDICGAGKFRTDSLTFARLVEAHTIERCAKVAESGAVYVRRSGEPTQLVHASDAAAYKAADKIRKLEV